MNHWWGAFLLLTTWVAAEPLPIETALNVRTICPRSSFEFSPDGKFLLYTVNEPGSLPQANDLYAVSGFPLSNGNHRTSSQVVRVKDGRSASIGEGNCWSGAWSPDGLQVAYYSDQGGEVGLWTWRRTDGERRRFPGVIARSYFGFEAPVWSKDGRSIYCKILPQGVTTAVANRKDDTAAPNPERVVVRRSGQAATHEPPKGLTVDLARLDLASGRAQRLVKGQRIRYLSMSPDGRRLAYTVSKGQEPHTQQNLYDLHQIEIGNGYARPMAENVRLNYGCEWSWSPDSGSLAAIECGPKSKGQMQLFSAADGHRVVLGEHNFDPGDGEQRPRWTSDGTVWGVSDHRVWSWSPTDKGWHQRGQAAGWNISHLVQDYQQPVLDGAPVALGTNSQGDAGFFRLEDSKPFHGAPGQVGGTFTLAESSQSVAYVAEHQRSPGDIWLADRQGGPGRHLIALNPQIPLDQLGLVMPLEWTTPGGEKRGGSLMFPYDHDLSNPPPMVVWVYGGAMGSRHRDNFGLSGMDIPEFNLHILASRGYAVLFPDTPLRVGHTSQDLLDSVMPGIDLAVENRFVDGKRLAVMGQSYGSYSALALITQTTRFRAAILTAVVHPDLVAWYGRNPAILEKGQGRMGGSLWEVPEAYRLNSPIFAFDKIQTPVLIAQGDQDGDSSGAEAVFHCLDRLGKTVEYRTYKGEGHTLQNPENVRDFWERRLQFLEEHLGPTP